MTTPHRDLPAELSSSNTNTESKSNFNDSSEDTFSISQELNSPAWWSIGSTEKSSSFQANDVPPTPTGDSLRDQILNPSRYHRRTQERTLFYCDSYHSKYASEHPTGWRGILRFYESPVLLILIAVFSSLGASFINYLISSTLHLRSYLSSLGFLPLVLAAASFSILSTLIVQIICPQASGSGLPEMKVAISGVLIKEYLSIKCLLAKSLGLLAAFAAGLSIGKEGPFILMSCSFADQIMNLQLFSRIKENSSKRLEMLACACAAGVVATFGTPFGGVLFSVEVTSTFYMVRNLPRSFFCAIVGSVIVRALGEEGGSLYNSRDKSSLGLNSNIVTKDYTPSDLVMFALLGCVCGLLGALMIYLISLLVQVRDYVLTSEKTCSKYKDIQKKVFIVLIVTILVNGVEYYGDKMWFLQHGGPSAILTELFSNKLVENLGDFPEQLLMFFPLKFFLTIFCVVLPIPAGIFSPTFVIGGIFGRVTAHMIHHYFPHFTKFLPFEFAIIGAAAFTSGVTRAISTAVIIMEISHHDYLHLPVSIAILAAYFTGNRFIENVYDVLITTNKLPQLKKLPKAAYDIPTWEVMKEVNEMKYLVADSTYLDCQLVLEKSAEVVFPIVDNHRNMILLGAVTRHKLQKVLDYCAQKNKIKPQNSSKGREISHTFIESIEKDKEKEEKKNIKTKKSNTPSKTGFGTRTERKSTPADIQIPVLNLLNWPVQFAVQQGGKLYKWDTREVVSKTKMTVIVNPAPYQIVEGMQMEKVDLIFRMLKLSNAYVTRCGRLVGMISRERLANFLKTARSSSPGVLSTMLKTFYDEIYSRCSLKRKFYKSIP